MVYFTDMFPFYINFIIVTLLYMISYLIIYNIYKCFMNIIKPKTIGKNKLKKWMLDYYMEKGGYKAD